MKIAVIGAGAWGTALALHFNHSKHAVSLFAENQTMADEINQHKENILFFKGFRLPENLQRYVFTKGFIGLDGCSLTVGEVKNGEFCVHLIPETLQRTLFGVRQVGDLINLEIDANTQAIVDTVERVLQDKGL